MIKCFIHHQEEFLETGSIFWQIIVGTKIIRGSGAKALERFFVTTFSFGGDCLNAGYVQCSHLQGKKKKLETFNKS